MTARRGRLGSPPGARVRLARLEDLDALVALEADTFPTDRADRRALRHAVRSPTMSFLVAIAARDGGAARLVGAAIVERRRTSRIARLSSLAVRPDWTGGGIGRLLLDAAATDALRHGCERLRLEVRIDNRPGIRLYEHAGFHLYGTKLDYYEDGTQAWCYERDLADA